MNKLICWLLGHNYLYNFKSMPDKAICSRCKTKWYSKYNEKADHPFDLHTWVETDKFTFTQGCQRTDEELIKQWVK